MRATTASSSFSALSKVVGSGPTSAAAPRADVCVTSRVVSGTPLSGILLSGAPLSWTPLSGTRAALVKISDWPCSELSGFDMRGVGRKPAKIAHCPLAGQLFAWQALQYNALATSERVVRVRAEKGRPMLSPVCSYFPHGVV